MIGIGTEQLTAGPKTEETIHQPERIEIDEDPAHEEADIEEPFFGFEEVVQRRLSTRTRKLKLTEKMKQFKVIHEALIGESWKEITASQNVPFCYRWKGFFSVSLLRRSDDIVGRRRLGDGHKGGVLITNGKWNMGTNPTTRRPYIQSKWVFDIIPGYKNTPPRFKVRLVAKRIYTRIRRRL